MTELNKDVERLSELLSALDKTRREFGSTHIKTARADLNVFEDLVRDDWALLRSILSQVGVMREQRDMWLARCGAAMSMLGSDVIVGDLQVAAKEYEAAQAVMREALEKIRRGPAKPAPDPVAHSWEAFARHMNGFAVDARMAAADALSTLPTVGGWQPIETAPRNPVARLVWCPDNRCTYAVHWWETDGAPGHWAIFGTGSKPLNERITHWMPLPPAPTPTKSEGEGS